MCIARVYLSAPPTHAHTARVSLSFWDDSPTREKKKLTSLSVSLHTNQQNGVPNLHELDLRSNALKSLPDELAELRTLKNVKLNYNKFETIPAVLTQLPRLTNVELGGNLITAVDETASRLPVIKELDLSGNQISSVHPSIAANATLTYLNFENNLLTALPEEMGTMVNLQRLDLSNNQLAALPASFGGLKGLTKMEVNNNKLASLPASMGHLKQLKELDCRYNQFVEPGKSKSEGPIAGFLEFLCEEEKRLKQEEIERLKPIPTMVGSYCEFRMKIAPKGQGQGNGGASDPTDDRPYLRSNHSMTWGANHVFIFGGTLAYEQRKVNDLYITNLDTMVWMKMQPNGERPIERDGHCTVFDPVRKRLLVFGGRSIQKKRLNDLFLYDMVSNTWTKMAPEGNLPLPRESGNMLLLNDNTAVLFGGRGSGQRYNDLHFLDLSHPKLMWTQPIVAGSAPSPRQDVALCSDGEGKIYVHAGRNNFMLDDLYSLDVTDPKNMTWMEVPTAGRPPPPCYGHQMAALNGTLYTYGGFDELGGQIMKCYSLDQTASSGAELPDIRISQSGVNSTPREVKKAEWIEMDCELAFNENRHAVISPDNTLYAMQVGSRALGLATHVATSDSFWDVCKHADLTDFKVKELQAEDRKPVNGKKMRVKHTTMSKGKELMDQPAVRNRIIGISPKEFKMLEYVNNFRSQFVELYPRRRPLMLDPPNECGVRKFICTTVRPSKLAYSELYNLDSCCEFVATYLEFERLESPILYPESIPSPYSSMDWQGGDCFDLAITLCSLLTGVGFDAYVCLGYAPQHITNYDQSEQQCPVLEREAAVAAAAKAAAAQGAVKQGAESKYKLKEPIMLESEFEKEMGAKAAAEAAAVVAEAKEKEVRAAEAAEVDDPDPAGEEDEEDEDKDEYDGKRVHAWVLVLAGKREVPESMFIEPTTARKYPLDASPYQGLECVWNSANYWVNMQAGTVLGAPGKVVSGVDFDLTNSDKWEAVLEGVDPFEASIGDGEGGEGGAAEGEGAEGDGGGGGGDAASESAGGEDPDLVVVEMPPSWVPKLRISRENFDTMCPRGQKITKFAKCSHEIFAVFGECSRWDGLTQRLCVFVDKACTMKEEERETYLRRRDKLSERVTYPLKSNAKLERFDPGSAFGIKEAYTVPDKERVMHFFPSARLDGLVKRVEVFGQKMMEAFSARDDHLVYRSVTYDPVETAKAMAAAEQAAAAAAAAGGRRKKKKSEEPLQVIRKMTEKFELPSNADAPGALPAHKCVRKRVFNIVGECTRIDYHYGAGRVTASQKLFYKDGTHDIVTVDPLEKKPGDIELQEEFQSLLAAEKQCTQDIRDVEKEIKDIVNNRNKEEQNINLITPYYDVVRVKQEESDDEGDKDEEKVEHDYLSPFLPALIAGQSLTKTECMDVRERCLKGLKDRLIERANIIQARHDEETAALAKRQANFQRDRDQMSRAEEEEYDRACDESMFRILILEQRLKRHEEQALQRYYELDSKLRGDGRLAILMDPNA
jgi:hypothetical protein